MFWRVASKLVSVQTLSDSPRPQAASELSLIRGGLFYRAQRATRIIRTDKWNPVRRLAVAIGIGWLPLVALTSVFHPAALSSLLRDYRVYSRMLIAVPVLLLGEALIESQFRMVIDHITSADLLDAHDLALMHDALDLLIRLRDSAFPELIIVALLIVHSVTSTASQLDLTPWLATAAGHSLHLTPEGWYAIVASATIYQFLLGLGLWRWILWSIFAFRLSRLNLKLAPTHPDLNGGLGFLGMTPIGLAPVVLAAAAVIGATWRHEILSQHQALLAFRLPAIILAVIVVAIAFGPLVFFVPRLAILRHSGLLEYGLLAQLHSRAMQEKWIDSSSTSESKLPVSAPEISILVGFSRAYDRIERLNPIPTDKVALAALVLCVLVPMVPTVLAAVPLKVVLKVLYEALR